MDLEDLCSAIRKHARPEVLQPLLPGVRLMASTRPTEPLVGVAEPTFALVARGTKRTIVGSRVYEYKAGQFLVVSIDLPVTGHVVEADPFLAFGMRLDPVAIATLMLETGTGSSSEPRGIGVSNATQDLVDPVVRLLRLLDRPKDLPVLRASIERELLWRLLEGPQGATVRQIGLADSRLAQINRAIQRIRTAYAEPLRIDELAHLAGMSATSFHRHFRSLTTMTPIQYQKQIRLQEARARLIAAADDIAAIGFAVGYQSPSQFSREYRRRFGRPPGQDAERLHAGR